LRWKKFSVNSAPKGAFFSEEKWTSNQKGGNKLKALGIVRKIDDLGRIVIPMEVRRVQGWEPGTPIEMFATDKGVVLQKYGAEEKRLAVIAGLESLSYMVKDETGLSIIKDIMDYMRKGKG
jgi:AbrB family transcriptional regulator, stage V sporulation protein T